MDKETKLNCMWLNTEYQKGILDLYWETYPGQSR